MTIDRIGLAVVGCGAIGRIRAVLARDYPGVGWLGLCDVNEALRGGWRPTREADFFTTDFSELIARPEVDAVIIATDGTHVEPILRGRRARRTRSSSRSRWPPTRASPPGC